MVITIKKFGKYEDKWVAVNKKTEKILASGKDIKEVTKKMKRWDAKTVIFKYIPPFDVYLAPSIK